MERTAVYVKYRVNGEERQMIGFAREETDSVLQLDPCAPPSAMFEEIPKSEIVYRVTFDVSELRRISDFVWCEPGDHETPAAKAVCIDDEDTWACPECAREMKEEQQGRLAPAIH